jgi:glutamine amidotransferase
MNGVAIIDYGCGNVASVKNSLARLGVVSILTSDENTILKASHVIFPGVGSAGAATLELKARGLDKLIPRISNPLLGICLGLQILCKSSEEEDTPCLNIFPYTVKRFISERKIPQIGWNKVTFNQSSPLFKNLAASDYLYFVHSYFVNIPDPNIEIAHATYGERFSAAIQQGNFFGVQFHPEKSGAIGSKIMENFLEL